MKFEGVSEHTHHAFKHTQELTLAQYSHLHAHYAQLFNPVTNTIHLVKHLALVSTFTMRIMLALMHVPC